MTTSDLILQRYLTPGFKGTALTANDLYSYHTELITIPIDRSTGHTHCLGEGGVILIVNTGYVTSLNETNLTH